MSTYETIDGGVVPIKAWTRGVPVEDVARGARSWGRGSPTSRRGRSNVRAKGDEAMLMGEGGIRSAVTAHLSFWDRVRVLFGARMVVHLDVRVEKDPGRMVSEGSHVIIGEPKGGQLIAESPR